MPTRTWRRELINPGEPRLPGQTTSSESPGSGDHWGSGCVDAGRIGLDPFAYIATLDPFHGTTACVYVKQNRGLVGSTGLWKRQILDVYGTPTQLKHCGDGPGHYIVCADFDGDGEDEFCLALFGSVDRGKSGESIPVR
jgi:aldos-2-ulose dehydratase